MVFGKLHIEVGVNRGFFMNSEVIYGINGPVITVKKSKAFSMSEMVYIGNDRLIGEVIKLNSDETVIQSYEETGG